MSNIHSLIRRGFRLFLLVLIYSVVTVDEIWSFEFDKILLKYDLQRKMARASMVGNLLSASRILTGVEFLYPKHNLIAAFESSLAYRYGSFLMGNR